GAGACTGHLRKRGTACRSTQQRGEGDRHRDGRVCDRKGELVTLDDISAIRDLVRDPGDEDAGHLTILPSPGGGWLIAFDFRRNASTMRVLADHAEGFLATARAALQAGH